MDPPAKHQDKVLPQTSWTLLAAVRQRGAAAPVALAEFTQRYYRPAYAYIAAIVRDPAEAEDITQEFFTTVVLSGRLWARLDRAKGSFRPYFKQALRRAVLDTKRRQARQSQHQLDAALRATRETAERERRGPAGQATPDGAFHAAWVQALLEEALTRVRQICETKGQTDHLALFLGRYLSAAAAPPSWRDLGRAYGIDEKAARSRAETVARHFRLVLRDLLVAETGSESSAEEEIATLLAFL